MKKFYIIAIMALSVLSVQAQQKLSLSTYNGTNLEKYAGEECDVTAYRTLFTGWNTLYLPFSMTESEVNEVFGSDCKLERLVGVESNGNTMTLNFQDCKSMGIEANVPYILHFSGEICNKKIAKTAVIEVSKPSVTFIARGNGETVTMCGAQTHLTGEGLYGVLAKDNSEATFTKVDKGTNGFFATRCYIEITGSTPQTLLTRHLAAGDVLSIKDIISTNERVDVYTLSGAMVGSQMSSKDLKRLQPGIYVVNGQKVAVK